MKSKGKVIVTGGTGYIGSHTAVSLVENGYDVVIFDDLSNSKAFILDRIEDITGKKPEFEKIDLASEEQTNGAYKKHGDADAIINFAAYKAVGESVKEPLKYYKNNLFSLLNTLHGQIDNDIKNIIFSSSATVYGEPDVLPITEKNETKRPFSPYGNTKKMAEEILEDFTKVNPNFSAISLRYFNPIGAHKSGLIGEFPSGTPNNLLPYITQCAAGVLEELKIFGSDYATKDGTPIRDYIHVVDLAEAHVTAVNRLLEKKNKTNYELFNLGTGNGYTVLDVINTFESVADLNLNYKIVGRRDGDVTALYAATDLAKQELNWKAKYGLKDMISSAWKWEQNLRSLIQP